MNWKRTPCPPDDDEAPRTATAMKKCVIACSSFGSPSMSCCSPWPRSSSSFAYWADQGWGQKTPSEPINFCFLLSFLKKPLRNALINVCWAVEMVQEAEALWRDYHLTTHLSSHRHGSIHITPTGCHCSGCWFQESKGTTAECTTMERVSVLCAGSGQQPGPRSGSVSLFLAGSTLQQSR